MTFTTNTPDPADETHAGRSNLAVLIIEWAIAREEGATTGQAIARVIGGAQPGKEARWINTVAALFLLGLGLGLELFMFSR